MKPNPLPTPTQLVFLASKVNGAFYVGNLLPACPHEWPTDTWFQRRREELREQKEQGDGDTR